MESKFKVGDYVFYGGTDSRGTDEKAHRGVHQVSDVRGSTVWLGIDGFWTNELDKLTHIDIKVKSECELTNSVNHPVHYNAGTIECIDAIEEWKLNFNLGNAVKYICRCEHKGTRRKDLEKAIWYIQREIASAEASVDPHQSCDYGGVE